MIVPDFWAEARRQERVGRKRITVRRFGWSNVSETDAQAMADRRADEALAAIVSGQALVRSEPRVAYNGADGMPIREEVLARHGEEVVTRNAYGARCLNTPGALFADIDLGRRRLTGPIFVTFVLLWLVLAPVSTVWLDWRDMGIGLGVTAVALVLAFPVAGGVMRAWDALHGGVERITRRRLVAFMTANPGWSARVYRTPAGFRVLVTHRAFEAVSDEVKRFFDAIGVDPVYARMCANQRCFRARLTAKPWRIGIRDHLRPRPGVWPVRPEQAAIRREWIQRYEEQASRYAACRFVETLGPGAVDSVVQPVVDLHDRECRALDPGLELA